MKTIQLILLICFPVCMLGQNVGIGTTTPSQKLEVKNLLRSTLKLSTGGYNDTTELLLSNTNEFNQGTEFSLKNIGEEGLFISSLSDLPGNTAANILVLKPNGFIGLNDAGPPARLTISGNEVTENGLSSAIMIRNTASTNAWYLRAGADGTHTPNDGFSIADNGGYHFSIDPSGNVGIGNNAASEKLDVSGSINVTGTIKANGVDGAPGQVMMKNSSGTLTWGDMCQYKNFVSFNNAGSSSWIVPLNVTKIMVEIWGAGGGGNNLAAGAGGGYAKAQFDVIPGITTVNYTVGAGGAGAVSATGITGGTSEVTANGSTVQATGGGAALYISATNGQGGVGGIGTGVSGFSNYIRMTGAPGHSQRRSYSQFNATAFYETGESGRGGDAANAPGTGGLGQYYTYNTTGSVLVYRNGNPMDGLRPGGGGSSGVTYGVNVISGGSGANGMIIIYY